MNKTVVASTVFAAPLLISGSLYLVSHGEVHRGGYALASSDAFVLAALGR
jgi:hypothetical protein